MDRVRRRKDDIELARMRLAADATCAGFAAAVPFIAPGISERALQIEIEAEFFRHGADLSRTTPSSLPARMPPCLITVRLNACYALPSSCWSTQGRNTVVTTATSREHTRCPEIQCGTGRRVRARFDACSERPSSGAAPESIPRRPSLSRPRRCTGTRRCWVPARQCRRSRRTRRVGACSFLTASATWSASVSATPVGIAWAAALQAPALRFLRDRFAAGGWARRDG